MREVHWIVLVVYLLVMLGIGSYFARPSKIRTGDDFMFAGRRLPRIVLVGTLLATWVGSGTIIGGANFAYSHGPLAATIFFAGTPLGILVLYAISAKLRQLSDRTVPELLERRFGYGVRMTATMFILLAYVGMTATQFLGGGYLISLLTPLSTAAATILIACVVAFLAVSGGLYSVAWTDFLSAGLIVLSLLVSLPIVLLAVGGPVEYAHRLPDHASTVTGGLGPLQLLGYFLPLFLLVLADQNLYQRLAAAGDERSARGATLGFLLSSFVIMIPIVLLGSAAAILLPRLSNPDLAVLALASRGVVPAWIGGLLLAGTLAFVVTTATSFMLSVGGNVVYDLYVRHRARAVSQRGRLWWHRAAVLGIALAAYLVGTVFPSVLDLQMHSYTVYGVAVTPVVLAALFWNRVTSVGAIACMVLGAVSVVCWELAGQPYGWNAVLVALPLALLGLIFGSLTSSPRRSRKSSGPTSVS